MMPRHFNLYLSARWPGSALIWGWSAGRLTFSAGFAIHRFCACLSLHFYEKDAEVTPYWADSGR